MKQVEVAAGTTWGIPPQIRRSIRGFVLSSRASLEEDFIRQLVTLEITPEGVGQVSAGRVLNEQEERAREAAAAVIEAAVAAGTTAEEAFETFVRDSAFTTLNRLVGLRCLEERGMLLVGGTIETAIRMNAALGTSSLYFHVRNEFPGDTAPREVWRMTLDRAYRAISERIGMMFDSDSEFGQLFPLAPTLTRLVGGLNDPGIPAETWAEDEILGWVYQYYNAEEKDAVYNKLGAKGKIERPEELAAATCLYTERYMVDFLLQNTLGALWVRMHPDTRLTEAWPYYLSRPKDAPESDDGTLPTRVRDITLLDPACGSGHFLARGFDLFAELYAEEGLEVPDEVAHLILERNLHGIDIDLRAIQISALRLFLKGCELAGPDFRPRRMNLVSTDVVLPHTPPAEFLARFEGDRELQDVIRAIWSELKDAPILGSLLHPERRIDELLERRRGNGATLELQDDAAWERFRTELLEGVRAQFEVEAKSTDISQHLFGEQAAKGLSLVEALGRHYDVVVTNPPYAGSRNLAHLTKQFIEHELKEGKLDLYAAFILRCDELSGTGGRVGMVTQQGWLVQKSYAPLRSRLLNSVCIDAIAQLGSRAFEEIGGEVVSTALFTLRNTPAVVGHHLVGVRVAGTGSAADKARLLARSTRGPTRDRVDVQQDAFGLIPDSPFLIGLRPAFVRLLGQSARVASAARLEEGYKTADNDRFLRLFWEPSTLRRWPPYEKGGGYAKWAGLKWYVVDWRDEGVAIRSSGRAAIPRPPAENDVGLTYSEIAQGSLGFRWMRRASAFDFKAHALFAKQPVIEFLCCVLNSRLASYLARALSPSIYINQGYVGKLPLPPAETYGRLAEVFPAVFRLKSDFVLKDPAEATFLVASTEAQHPSLLGEALLHTLEGLNERLVFDAYELDDDNVQAVLDETGSPAGWHPFISGYDVLPEPPKSVELPEGLNEFLESLEHRELAPARLAALKARLRALYVAGPGAKVEEDALPASEDEEEQVLGAHIPIPTETFLEELSVKLQVHPISVFQLLEEMRDQEGLVSPPEIRRSLEEYVTVSVLRLLGYRWPEQDVYETKHGPIIDPELVDPDGVIPLVVCNDEPTLVERVRTRMERQFGEEGAEDTEREFRTYVGKDPDSWLEKEFFRTHVQRFKNRPIAWHLTSPEGTFQAIVLYHCLSRETLQRISNLYAAGLINRLRAELQLATERGNERAAQDLRFQIEDVEEFLDRLRAIEEGRELANRIRCRWKDEEQDGRPGPYAPDIDDGVKVNIRPFQETGLLTRQVIKKW